MIGILAVGVVVLWVIVLLWLISTASFIDKTWISLTAAFFWFVIPTGLLIQSNIDNNEKHPCAQYGTQMRYDAALKMMRPMKVCTLRGEWEDVKE